MGPRRRPTVTKSNDQAEKESSSPPSSASLTGSSTRSSTRKASFSERIPRPLRFPILVTLSLSISLAGLTAANWYTGADLSEIARGDDEHTLTRMAQVYAHKIVGLAIAWFSGYDWRDQAAFSYLTNLPQAYLLVTFYEVPAMTVGLNLAATLLALTLPFFMLRTRSTQTLQRTRNALTADLFVTVLTVSLATLLYTLPLLLALSTFLPRILVTRFDGLRTLAPAHGSSVAGLLFNTAAGALLPAAGLAARHFLFSPLLHLSHASAQTAGAKHPRAREFDPVKATLAQTIEANILWFTYLPPAERERVQRTAALAFWTAVTAAFTAWVEVHGAELYGSAAWAAVWALSAILTGEGLAWTASGYGSGGGNIED